jgi:hypothetical protein
LSHRKERIKNVYADFEQSINKRRMMGKEERNDKHDHHHNRIDLSDRTRLIIITSQSFSLSRRRQDEEIYVSFGAERKM